MYTQKRIYQSFSRLGKLPLLLSLVFSLNCQQIFANDFASPSKLESTSEQHEIKGIIKDASGEPLIGALIIIEGTTTGTTSRADGTFNLAVKEGDVVVVSYIGYNDYKETIAKQGYLEVVMMESSLSADEVVVVGYGSQKKINLTGSVSSLSGEDIAARPVTSVTNALQGVIPGLNMSFDGDGGELNNTMSVDIRGGGTIGEGSSSGPLILIDNAPGDMNSLNPQDIENISVLKDAAASSIYGSRAPFGVILITTKKGEKGKARINYQGDFRVVSPISLPDQMNSLRWVTMYNDGHTNAGSAAAVSQTAIDKIIAYQAGEIPYATTVNNLTGLWSTARGANGNTDWYDVYYKDQTYAQNHAISVSGGGEKVNYYFSTSYLNQQGLMRYGDDQYTRYNIRAKIDFQLNDYITASYNTSWAEVDYERPSYMTSYFYHQISRRWVTNPVYDPNGFFMEDSDIYRLTEGGRYNEKETRNSDQLNINIRPTKNWNINFEGNMNTIGGDYHQDILPVYGYNASGEPYPVIFNSSVGAGQSSVSEKKTSTKIYTVNAFTDYTFDVAEDHNVKVLAGFNADVRRADALTAQRDSLIVASLPALSTASGKEVINWAETHQATTGFFGRINYNYKDRYMAEINARYDGSSRFVGDQRWNLFPSFSGGWNIAKEDFWGDFVDVVNQFKFRASWGELGNQNTTNLYPFYQTLPYTKDGNEWLLGGSLNDKVNMPSMISSLLTWEKIRTLNLGLDFAMFSNRLKGSIDVFNRQTLDMVGPAPSLPSTLGTSAPIVNNADMSSKGYEIEISWRDKIGDFSYGIKGNLYDATQTVDYYPDSNGNIYNWYSGKKSGEIWGYETVGIAKSDAEMQAHLEKVGGQDRIGDNWAAGDIMYADKDGVEGITPGSSTLDDHGDLSVIGNSTPRYRFGITVDAAWKGFDFQMFWQGIGKRDISFGGTSNTVLSNSAQFWGIVGNAYQSVGFEDHWDYFRPEGHEYGANLDAYYPRPNVDSEKNHRHQTAYLLSGAYIRLKNVQLGYTVPVNLVQKIGVSRLRVYVSADNMLTFTKMASMFDPETLGGGWGAGKTYPLSKVVSMGINLNF